MWGPKNLIIDDSFSRVSDVASRAAPPFGVLSCFRIAFKTTCVKYFCLLLAFPAGCIGLVCAFLRSGGIVYNEWRKLQKHLVPLPDVFSIEKHPNPFIFVDYTDLRGW